MIKSMEWKYTEIKKHPLRECWMLYVPDFPSIPPFFGTRKECDEARVFAERKASECLIYQSAIL